MDKIKNTSSFISAGERDAQFSMLMHVQEFSSMAVLVCGEKQAGKTTFLQAAQAHLAQHHQVASIDALISSNKDLIIESLAEVVTCPSSDTALAQALSALKESNESIYLFIDDAHLLEKEALNYVLVLCMVHTVLHLTLAGDDGLQDTLNELQQQYGQDSIYHLISLAALSEEESNQFVSEVYAQAGFEVLPLSAQKLHQFYVLSKGVPGLLMDLIEAEQSQQEKRLQRFPLGHVAAILLIGTALSFSYFYQDDTEAIDSGDAIAQLLQEKTKVKNDGILTNNEQRFKEPKNKVAVQKMASLSEGELAIAIPAKNAQKIASNRKSTVATPAVDSSIGSPKKITALNTMDDKPKVTKAVVVKKPHRLLAVSPNAYALQLLGVRSKKSVQEFMRRFARQLDSNKLNVYQTQYKGQPWYVVVYGPFGDKIDANKEALLLSQSLKSRPWIRPLSQIQGDIKKK